MCVPSPKVTLSIPTGASGLEYTQLWVTEETARGNRERCTLALGLTVLLAVIFTGFQAYEYIEAPFTIMDGIYGSTFFMLTGFHGLHVIVGTIFLTVCLFRNLLGHFSATHHIGFEGAV
jgi:heme/copper-type cytochrome/quinol oxidase subunit 3